MFDPGTIVWFHGVPVRIRKAVTPGHPYHGKNYVYKTDGGYRRSLGWSVTHCQTPSVNHGFRISVAGRLMDTALTMKAARANARRIAVKILCDWVEKSGASRANTG